MYVDNLGIFHLLGYLSVFNNILVQWGSGQCPVNSNIGTMELSISYTNTHYMAYCTPVNVVAQNYHHGIYNRTISGFSSYFAGTRNDGAVLGSAMNHAQFEYICIGY